MVIIISTAMTYAFLSMNQVTQAAQTAEIKQTVDLQKTTEKFDVTTITNVNNQFNMTVTNRGDIPVHLTRLWVENTTDSLWPASKYDLDIAIPSGGSVTNIGQNLGLTALDTQSYIIKLVTERGNTQKMFIDSVGAVSFYLSLSAIPTIVPTTFSTTLVLEVINTGSHKLINLQPEMDSVITSCAVLCSATLVSGPTPTNFDSLDPGNIAIFEWVYTITGDDTGDSATFTASLVNGIDEDTAVVTVQPIINAENVNVALSANQLGTVTINNDILLFHMEQSGVPSPGYQMMSSDVDGGTSGLLFNMETQTAGSAVAFMTNNGTSTITIPAGNWNASLALRSEAVATAIQTEDEDMIFHMEDGDGVNPDNSEGDSSRDLAECAAGGSAVWCNISSAICDANWDNRFKIVIDETKVEPDTGSHTNFPVLVSITGTDFTSNLDGADDSINDIRFLDGAGALLDYEIEKYDKTSDELIAWVQIASLSTTTDHTFYMYFDNAETSGYGDEQDAIGTWDSNYIGVYHLNADWKDSTGTYDGTSTAGPSDISGKIGTGQEFFGDEEIDIGDITEMNSASKLTMSGWGSPDTLDNMVMGRKEMSDGFTRPRLDATGDVSNQLGGAKGLTTSGPVQAGVFGYWVMVYDGTLSGDANRLKFYFDGSQETLDFSGAPGVPATTGTSAGNMFIGRHEFWDGTIDEFRIAGTAHSADYLKTEFNNQNSPSTFYALTVESTGGAGGGGVPDWQAGSGPHLSGSYYYDGNACHQSTNNISSGDENDIKSADTTTSLWFRTYPASQDAGISSEQMLVSWNSSDDYYKISLGQDGTGTILFEYDDGGSTVSTCRSVNEYDDGNWHHVVAVKTNSNDRCDLYITDTSGADEETPVTASPNHGNSSTDVDGKWYVGSKDNTSNYFKGWIDDVMHWNGDALTSVQVDDLSHTNYGTAAHKLDVNLDRTDENGVFETNLYTFAESGISFQDNKAQADTVDAAYAMFNVTMNMPQTVLQPLQRLNFSLAFVPSTSTWEALELDMKIDDTGFSPHPSYLQIPFPDNPFNGYIVYDNDFELNLFINNIGTDGVYFIYSGTRVAFDDGLGGSYASLIHYINGTTPTYFINSTNDSIYIPAGNSSQMYFYKEPTDHPCQGAGSTCGVANIIPAGSYRLAAWVNGYSDQGETFGRSMMFGTVDVVE